jgi:uncharacterized YigZ family protein
MKQTIAKTVEIEYVVDKSRFIGILLPVASKDLLHAELLNIRQRHPKANHVVLAALIGDSQSLDDDGEPAKTSALPMLEVLQHHQLTNVAMVAIRYFGGIKLGAGGLVRAYTKTASMAVETATFLVPETRYPYHLRCTYETYYKLPTLVTYQLIETTFEEMVDVVLWVNESERTKLETYRHLFVDLKEQPIVVEYVAKKD